MATATKEKATKAKPETAVVTTPDKSEANGAAGPKTIRIDLDQLRIGDLELLDRAGRRDLPTSEMVELLDRVVVGGARLLPLTRLGEIIEALGEAVGEAANPGN